MPQHKVKPSNKKSYCKPVIKTQKIQLNFFYTKNSRMDDSINNLLGMNVIAASGGCGCGSCKNVEQPV